MNCFLRSQIKKKLLMEGKLQLQMLKYHHEDQVESYSIKKDWQLIQHVIKEIAFIT